MIQRGLVLLALVAFTSFGAVAAPTIHVDSATYTTKADSNSVVAHTFQLSNAGDSPLTIGSVTASCGCTATTLNKTELAPGESVGLEAKVNTTGFSGTVQKTVTVHTNDPATPSLVLRMTLELPAAAPAPAASTPASPTPVAASATPAVSGKTTESTPTASTTTATTSTPAGTPATAAKASGERAVDWLVLAGALAVLGIGLAVRLWRRKRGQETAQS